MTFRNTPWIILCLLCCSVHAEQVTLSGSWLYWKAQQEGLAFTNSPASVFTTTDFTTSRLVDPDFEWRSGFRLAADYTPCGSPWTAGLHILNYRGAAHSSKRAGGNDGIFPVLSFADSILPTDYVTSAQINWKLHATLVDVVGGCCYCLDDGFTITPTLSLRNVWISQQVTTDYSGATFSAGVDSVDLRSYFYGIGPRVGINPVYCLGSGFSVYGEAAASVLYGSYDVHQQENFLSTSMGSLHRAPHGARWNVDTTVGISWKGCMTFDLGFDFLYFSQQYAFKHGPQFSLPHQSKYLLLYGLHLSAGLGF